MTRHYQASCHCGAIKLSFDAEQITSAMRCTCSICARKGAMMTPEAIDEAALKVDAAPTDLGLYQFDSKVAKHYFCNRCGIYTHNETARFPGKYRINLGCIDDLDSSDFDVVVFDGKNLL